jgi:ribose-phosphate pyrophosphokinase
MMNPILFTLPGSDAFCAPLCAQLNSVLPCDMGELQIDYFSDDECSPRFITPVAGRDVIFCVALDHPDSKIMPVLLAACVARELGASSVGFVIPYLPYMKQDSRYKDGEGDTAHHFARLISGCCDWVLTAKPYLHHHTALSEIYTAKTMIVDVVPEIASWIAGNVTNPVLFALNANSAKWIAEISEAADCPYTILDTTNYGDSNVAVSIPDASFWIGMTPVLIEEIVSSARTMTVAVRQIELAGMAPPVCIAVHPLFAGDTYDVLQTSQVDRIVSCNTVAHVTNRIDLCQPFAQAIVEIMATVNATR